MEALWFQLVASNLGLNKEIEIADLPDPVRQDVMNAISIEMEPLEYKCE